MQTVIGLVGCGNWGKNILRDLILLKCTVYVADINPDVCKIALGMGAQNVFPVIDEFPECDGYVLAVPIPDLGPICARLLERKKPVFAEKTLLQSLQMADDLEKLGANDYVFAMHKWVYHPGIEALRIISQSGRIGQFKEMFCIRHGWVEDFHGGDVFWTLTIHDLTIVNHIFGYLPHEVIAANFISNSDGIPVSLTVTMGKSPTANLFVNARHTDKVSRVSIHGDKGSAILHDATDSHIIVRNENGEEKLPIDTTFPLFLELKEFVDYLHGGQKPRCNFQQAKDMTKYILHLRKNSTIL